MVELLDKVPGSLCGAGHLAFQRLRKVVRLSAGCVGWHLIYPIGATGSYLLMLEHALMQSEYVTEYEWHREGRPLLKVVK